MFVCVSLSVTVLMDRAIEGILIGCSPVTLAMGHSLFTMSQWSEILPVLACAVWVALRHNQNANHVKYIYHFLYSLCYLLSTHL